MFMNVEKIEKKVVEEKVTWVALDGTVFENENDCKEWEDSFKCAVTKTFNDMPKCKTSSLALGTPYSNDDHTVYVVMPNCEADIMALNSIIKYNDVYGVEGIGLNDIGRKFIMVCGWYSSGKNMLFGGSDYIEIYDFDKHFRDITNEFMRIETEIRKQKENSEVK